MSELINKVKEYVELHKQTYKQLFNADLSFVDVQDFTFHIRDIVKHQIEKNKDQFNKIVIKLSSDLKIPRGEVKRKLEKDRYKKDINSVLQKEHVPLMSFGSPNYPNTIFVYDCKKNQDKLVEPFTDIEYGSIHELGHAFFKTLTNLDIWSSNDRELIMKIGMATEGFTDILMIEYIVPHLNSRTISEKAEKYKQNYFKINRAVKGKITKERFGKDYEKFPEFRNALAYSLFTIINSEFGFEGLKTTIKNLPELKDYLPGNKDYIDKIKLESNPLSETL